MKLKSWKMQMGEHKINYQQHEAIVSFRISRTIETSVSYKQNDLLCIGKFGILCSSSSLSKYQCHKRTSKLVLG